MALTNSMPLNMPIAESEVIRNSKSPHFHASYLAQRDGSELLNGSDSSNSPSGSSIVDESDSQSPKSASDNTMTNSKKSGSPGASSTANYSGAISRMVPVTGERPKPENTDPPLNDDVLHAVFVILWEHDPDQHGMTVKQLCDLLVERHPNMTNLSTKLSNLVSAKLNAYVKKVEKGEKMLRYALSREWSDASPRRMVYVYRGILAPEYQRMALAASAQQRNKSQHHSGGNGKQKGPNSSSSQSQQYGSVQLSQQQQEVEFNSTLVDERNAGSFSRSLGVNAFSNGIYGNTEINVPYASSPVTLGLATRMRAPDAKKRTTPQDDSKRSSTGSSNSALLSPMKKARTGTYGAVPTFGGQQYGIDASSTTSQNYVTAAAAAPRLSKVLTTKTSSLNTGSTVAAFQSSSNSNVPATSNKSTAAVIAALHRAITTQTPITVSLDMHKKPEPLDIWIKTIREGFLTQEVDSPESVTVDELDDMFL